MMSNIMLIVILCKGKQKVEFVQKKRSKARPCVHVIQTSHVACSHTLTLCIP
jgi:hypothetical protein